MSDESPRDESAADNAPADDPAGSDEPTVPSDVPPPAPPPPPADPPPRQRSHVLKWAAAAAAAVVLLFGGGFAIGHVTAGGDGDDGGDERAEQEAPDREDRDEGGDEDRDEGRPTSGVFLGVAARDATGDQQGAEIQEVASGSPAAEAGLEEGDVVTAVDGSAVTSASDLAREVREHESGDRVTVTYTRDGNSAQAEVTLGDRADADA
jgi:membrane-associated protease RseP (regulator of RpoE activity)